jgi:hypothetical protein
MTFKLQAATRLSAASKRPNEDRAIHEIMQKIKAEDQIDAELKTQNGLSDRIAALGEDQSDLDDVVDVIKSLGYKQEGKGVGTVLNFHKQSPKPNQTITITVIWNKSRKAIFISAAEYDPDKDNL